MNPLMSLCVLAFSSCSSLVFLAQAHSESFGHSSDSPFHPIEHQFGTLFLAEFGLPVQKAAGLRHADDKELLVAELPGGW
jgi:hypothetical protein